jgi:hypothetical protein
VNTYADGIEYAPGATKLVLETAGQKKGAGKLPLELLPVDVLVEVAKVLQFGSKKYAANNWRGGIKYSRVFGATMRHLFAWWLGEDNDAETGLSHLAHALCEISFLLAYSLRSRTELDDRQENNA